MAKCKYNQAVFGQVVDCLIEDCENCRYNPDIEKSLKVVDKITEAELKHQENNNED